MKNMISRAKADYYVNIINDCCGDQKNSFKLLINYLAVKRKLCYQTIQMQNSWHKY